VNIYSDEGAYMPTPKNIETYSGVFFRLYRKLGSVPEIHEIEFKYKREASNFRLQCYGFGKALERKIAKMTPAERTDDPIGYQELFRVHKETKIKLEGKTLRFVNAATERNPMIEAAEASLAGLDDFDKAPVEVEGSPKNDLEPELTGDFMKDVLGDFDLDEVDEL
jgi:hypothetical protein